MPALLFGLRLWASICLALYVAFWLQLDNPSWAATTAATMCQPQLGASLRKGWSRMVGTLVGAVAIVLLTACFPQGRGPFLVGLALWGAASALAATLLRTFPAYAAALAGYTAVIVASDTLGATGGPDGQVFMLAIYRVSEICLGIVSAGVVLAGTDLGGARRRLATSLAALAVEVTGRFVGMLALAGPGLPETRPVRRELLRRVIALDPVIDQAIGESATLRDRSPVLQSAADGLFAALVGWRAVANHLRRLPGDQARAEAAAVLRNVPAEFRPTPEQGGPTARGADDPRWTEDAVRLRRVCMAAARRLVATPAGTPSPRLLLDHTAKLLAGVSRTLDGLALLADDPAGPPDSRRRAARLRVPDWLPALVNAGRAFVVIGAMELFWILSAWPSGALAITWTAIPVILMAPRADQAYASAVDFAVGAGLAALVAAIILFVVLPGLVTFVAFSIVLGLVLVPAGALMTQPWRAAVFASMVGRFPPLLGPANEMSYDTVAFYNSALAIIVGSGVAALSFRLLPPLSPAFRTRRLLALTLRDLRRLARGPVRWTPEDWEGRVFARLTVLPAQAEPVQRAQLLAALSAGNEIIRLRRIGPRLGLGPGLDAALDALARGDSGAATARLARLDHLLASRPVATPGTPVALRARGSMLALSEVLTQHASYFDAEAPG
ncbi:MAG TPA: FUSC family protein [Crenalkalicoccus sp.]|nr:FUSC family protein [Crenalkalicoccus sp.]